MNRPNVEEIKARADAATPGPWAIDEFNGVIESHSVRDRVNEPSHDWEYRAVSCSLPEKAEDAEFIAASRADIPELLAYIAHLEARLAAVSAIHTPHSIYDQCDHEHTADEIGTRGVVDVGEIGLTCEKMYDICSECCVVRDDGSQSETCATYHTHGLDLPICKTSAALRACGYKEPTE